jgi:hypothetical protein
MTFPSSANAVFEYSKPELGAREKRIPESTSASSRDSGTSPAPSIQ